MADTVSRTPLRDLAVYVYTGRHEVDSNAELVQAYDGLDLVAEFGAWTELKTIRWHNGQTPRSMRRAA